MTQEDKELLLKDLSARLPYGVMILHKDEGGREVTTKLVGYNGDWFNYYIDNLCFHLKIYEFKPYLRPMSNMTEEERIELINYIDEEVKKIVNPKGIYLSKEEQSEYWDAKNVARLDWLNAHHFDYRGLIEKGLALEAPEGMYKFK